MTDLLNPVSSRASATAASPRRPLALAALLAGVGAPAVALSLLWFLGLVGWYADDGGSHGTTLTVLRVAADGWLLAHGSPLGVQHAVVTASPLGLTLLCGYLTYRLGRRAGAASDAAGDLRAVGLATVVLAGSYAAVALLAAVLAGTRSAEPGLGPAFLGGALVGAVFGGAGLVRGAGLAGELRRLVPVPALSVAYGAVVTVLTMTALGALLAAVGLAAHWTAAVRVVDHLHLDVTGALLSLALLVGIAPNVALLAATYLLGPGFAVGTGTVVSPAEVHLGPVPSVPVLAALPDDGWAPGWTIALLAVPVLAAVVAAVPRRSRAADPLLPGRRGPRPRRGCAGRRPARRGRLVRGGRHRAGADGRSRRLVRRDAAGRAGRPGDRCGARRAGRHLVEPAPRRPRGPAPGDPADAAGDPAAGGAGDRSR